MVRHGRVGGYHAPSDQVVKFNRKAKHPYVVLDAKYLDALRNFYLSMVDSLPTNKLNLRHDWIKMSSNCKRLYVRYSSKKGKVGTRSFERNGEDMWTQEAVDAVIPRILAFMRCSHYAPHPETDQWVPARTFTDFGDGPVEEDDVASVEEDAVEDSDVE